jgi:hypothetical protein
MVFQVTQANLLPQVHLVHLVQLVLQVLVVNLELVEPQAAQVVQDQMVQTV